MHSGPGGESTHPKDALYDKVYEPLTKAWFDALSSSKRRQDLLAEAHRHDLLHNLDELNSLLYELVDACFHAPESTIGDATLPVVRQHRLHVLWEDQDPPDENADDQTFRTAISNKIKRNISMGAVEIVICLEGAIGYGKKKLGLTGPPLAQLLKRSSQLGGSLALLHDVQEQHRLQDLTGEDSYLKYPQVTFANVIDGPRYRIRAEKFVEVGSGDELRLRFVSLRLHPAPEDNPTRRCPAFKFPHRSEAGLVLNDELWRLIVDLYLLSKPSRLG